MARFMENEILGPERRRRDKAVRPRFIERDEQARCDDPVDASGKSRSDPVGEMGGD